MEDVSACCTLIVDYTYRFWSDELVVLDGKLLPISLFFTRTSVLSNFATVKRLSGSDVIAVDSR